MLVAPLAAGEGPPRGSQSCGKVNDDKLTTRERIFGKAKQSLFCLGHLPRMSSATSTFRKKSREKCKEKIQITGTVIRKVLILLP